MVFTNLVGLSVLFASLTASSKENFASEERIWSVCSENGSCSCGPDLYSVIQCTENSEFIKIQNCYCMFYDEQLNMSLLGTCQFSCNNYLMPGFFYYIERYAVANGSLFNIATCSNTTTVIETYREGRFCGQCRSGYGLAAYSYQYTVCIECTDYSYKSWIKYFSIALLPLTLFVFLVIILKINVPSSHLNGAIFTMQCITFPAMMRLYNELLHDVSYQVAGLKAIYVISGIFNLDFLRDIYTPFCLHPNLNIIHVIFLDYLIALYPYLLIILTYILIRMYNRNYFVIVQAWRPFKWCLKRYNREWDVGASLVQTFASLILLSSVKILGVMLDVLTPTRAYATNGSYHYYLYYDANIEYFHGQHLYNALLSITFSFVFVILPFLLLIVYPCRCFQRILNLLHLRCPALHIFMDAFQGCYKIEPYDLRYFSAFHLLLRFLLLLLIAILRTPFLFPAAACLMLAASMIFALFRPYRNDFHNVLDVIAMMLLALFFIAVTASILAYNLDGYWGTTGFALAVGAVIASFLYALANLSCNNLRKFISALQLRYRKQVRTSTAFARSIESFDQPRGCNERSTLIITPAQE